MVVNDKNDETIPLPMRKQNVWDGKNMGKNEIQKKIKSLILHTVSKTYKMAQWIHMVITREYIYSILKISIVCLCPWEDPLRKNKVKTETTWTVRAVQKRNSKTKIESWCSKWGLKFFINLKQLYHLCTTSLS